MTPEQEIEKLIADQARRIADLEAVLRHIARISTQDCSPGQPIFALFLEIEKMARGALDKAET